MTPAQVREALRHRLPVASLVLGPGAWDLVTGQAEAAGAFDVIAIGELTADTARAIVRQAYVAAPGTAPWSFIIRLDGAAEPAQQALLKVLEDAPATAVFVLTADGGPPLQTVMSRCRVLPLAGPHERELPEEQPDAAETRAAVAAAIRAARSGQPALLSAAVRGWGPEHGLALGLWAQEAAAGAWERFSPDFAPGVTPAQALRILEVLRRYDGARTAAAVALDRVLAPRER